MAYKSLIDYYGGGMVKPSDGYQLGGLVAGARRQRDYSGELRGLQESAERAAKNRKKLGGSFLGKLLVGGIGTALGGPAGGAAALAGAQALRERRHKKTDFSGGKYAQDIRGKLGEKESQFKDQGLARVGIAGVEGYLGGKSGGMFDKAAGGLGQLRDIGGFLREGGTLGDVLGGYAQKAGEAGIFGKGTALQKKAFDVASKRGITPSMPRGIIPSAQAVTNTTDEQDFQHWAGRPSDFAMSANTTDEQDFQQWAGTPSQFAMGANTTDEQDFQEWTGGIPSQSQPSTPQGAMAEGIYQLPAVNVEGVRPDPSNSVPAEGGFPAGEPLTQSSIKYPEWSMQASEEVPVPYSTYGLLSGQYDGPYGFGQPQIQTAGGFGSYKGGGLIEGLMPRGYQSGGEVGYGTTTSPEDALRQMGMGEVADDPRLEKYMEDLPQFTMGYKQQLGDITAGARSSLMDISQQGRMQQAGSGFAGGGAGSMGQSRARQGLQRQFGTQRRGLVEGYQADLLSAIADIEGKGGFEFGSSGGSGHSGSISDTEAVNTMTGYGGAEEQANASGAPQNAYSGQAWTNADGVELKWSSSRNNWLPEDQWDYYAQSQPDWA